MTPILRFVGDVHEEYTPFLELCEDAQYVIQVGDLGFNYNPVRHLDPSRVRVLAGNHDYYEKDSPNYFRKIPLFLGDWGVHTVPEFGDIFYVRGAWSIDGEDRRRRIARGRTPSWWEEEELQYVQLEQAILQYKDVNPDFVVTHECPFSILPLVTDPQFARNYGFADGAIRTRTNQALQMMLEAHRPKTWVFGHYHKFMDKEIDGTRFICLDMMRGDEPHYGSYVDFDLRMAVGDPIISPTLPVTGGRDEQMGEDDGSHSGSQPDAAGTPPEEEDRRTFGG